jgi:hypothetical protein
LEGINPNLTLRTRTLGKALLASCIGVKQTNKGKAYLVTDIVADIKDYVAAPAVTVETTSVEVEEVVEQPDPATKKKGKKGKKKDKGKDSEEKAVPVISPEEAFDLPKEQPVEDVDVAVLMAVANDFADMGEYEGYLSGKSRQGLIKHLNKAKLPIRTDGYSDEDIVRAVLRLFDANMPIPPVEVAEELPAEAEKVTDAPKKKGKKKDKNKAPKIDVEELNNLSKKGKGKKNKKGKNKKNKK